MLQQFLQKFLVELHAEFLIHENYSPPQIVDSAEKALDVDKETALEFNLIRVGIFSCFKDFFAEGVEFELLSCAEDDGV